MSRELVEDEELLLGLLNSTPVVDGGVRDELAGADAAGRWLRRWGGPGDAADRAAALQARAVLQDLVRGTGPADALSPLLAGVSRVPEMALDGLRWRLDVPRSRQVAVRAVLAWAALAATMPGRLRPCGNAECRLYFVDRSRAGNGRWCSMAVCGNRLKARRHHARGRSEPPTEP